MAQKVIGKWAQRSASGENDWTICFEQGDRTGYAIVRQDGTAWDIVDRAGLTDAEVHMLIFMAGKHSPRLARHLHKQTANAAPPIPIIHSSSKGSNG